MLRVLLQQAGVAVDDGQGSFQLVGDAGDEILAQQLVAAQLPRHQVEVLGQLVHLVPLIRHVELHVEIAAGDGAGGFRQVQHPPGEGPEEDDHEKGGKDEIDQGGHDLPEPQHEGAPLFRIQMTGEEGADVGGQQVGEQGGAKDGDQAPQHQLDPDVVAVMQQVGPLHFTTAL